MLCNYCERRCDLSQGRSGFCKMYCEEEGVIKERFPNRWFVHSVSHIESVPFFHVYPGSRSLVFGTAGCNFDCRYCSNHYVAKEDPAKLELQMLRLTPRRLVDLAIKMGCHNLVFNINEPTVSLPSLQELAAVARAAGMPLGCLTNGYMTEEATEIMLGMFSFFNVSLKGISDDFYRRYVGVNSVGPVLRNIRRLAGVSHVEIISPIIESVNDGEIDAMADFIAGVDPEIPWHVFRLLPEYRMKDAAYPSIAALNEALRGARERLSYVYVHNFVGSDWVNTLCPQCGSPVVERYSLGACGGGKLARYLCPEAKCPACGREIRMVGGYVPWSSREVAK